MTASDTRGRAWSRLWAAIRRGLSLRAVILACLTCGLAAESVKLFDVIRMTLSPRLEQSHVAQAAHAARHTGGIDVGAIAAAHLFGRHDPATQRESAANGREELSLSGILFFSGKNSLSRIMLMEYPKTSFAVGDRVTENVVVGAISPRYAILSDGGRQRVLRLSWKKRNPGGGGTANGNFNDDLDASNDDSSKPPPVLEPYEDPVGDG